MKLNVFVDKTKEEKIDIYVHEEKQIVEDIKKLISEEKEIICYNNSELRKVNFSEVVLFSVENERLAVFIGNEKLYTKDRLYMIEEKMPGCFIKLNQSAIGNIKRIKKFDCSVSGTLKVIFDNGLEDFVSRRQLKAVRERLGI